MNILRLSCLTTLSLAFIFIVKPNQATAASSSCHAATSCQQFTPPLYCSQELTYSPNLTSSSPNLKQFVIATSELSRDKLPGKSEIISVNPTPTHPITPTSSPTVAVSPPEPTQALELEPEEANSNPVPDIPEGSLSADKLFELINAHRANIGLPAFQKDDYLCGLANSRAPEIQNEIFGDASVHQGFNQKKLDYWITENMVSQPTEEAALEWWLRSGLHRQAIESSKHTHSCGVCVNRTCAQLFTSFVPK